MADKKLNIKVGLKGAKKAEKGLGKVNNSMKSMAKTAVAAGAAFFGARAIISGLSAVIKLAGEQEQAEKKLEVALGRTSKALLNQATALQKVTTFGDEAIIGVQASLAAFLDSEEAIKKATEATLDISVAMGMDLKAAGDLVAKTLGSSTNAMSRYGIQVEGAVGSTERLESLTGNVAKLFGGQAKAQAETMTGALDQMKNALGDVAENIGESLSPLVVKLAKGIKNLATSTADESAEADSLFNVLKDVNATEEVRERAMQAINEQYGDYLPNLIDETFSLQDIEKAQDRVTGAMLKRIALSVNEEKIADLMRDKLGLMDIETALIDKVAAAHERTQKAIDKRIAKEKKLGGTQIDIMARAEEGRKIAFEESKKLRLAENREGQIENQKEINKLNEDAISLAESFNQTIFINAGKPLINLFDEDDIDILPDVIVNMQEMADMMDEAFGTEGDAYSTFLEKKKEQNELSAQELLFIERLKSEYPELAASLGLLSDTTAISAKHARELGSAFGSLASLNKAAAGGFRVTARLQQAASIANTYAAATAALAPPPVGYGPTPIGYIAAGGAIAAGLANVLEISRSIGDMSGFAQGGIVPGSGTGDTVPAMLTPGEVILNKAQQENLVGGMGVTINIQGGIVQEDYVVNELLPAINKAKALA